MVRGYQLFLRKISLLFFMVVYGCSTYTPSKQVLLKEKSFDSEVVRNYFCNGAKQSNELKFNFTLLNPKTTKGIPLSKVGELASKIEEGKSCLYKNLIFELSQIDSNVIYVEVPDEIFKKIQTEEIGLINPDSLRANCKLITVFVQSPNSKVIGVPASQCTDGNGHKFFSGSNLEFDYFNSHKLKIYEISNLISGFSMVEPKEFQDETYSCEQNKELCDCIGSKIEHLGLDSEDRLNSEQVIEEKVQIWKRYINRFSRFKESVNEDHSKVEISLDLNSFCRYGRSVDDLTSK